jgi:hypothetical protein
MAEWNLQENAVRGFANVFRESVGIVKESWGGIVAAIGKGDLSTAGQIAATALELIWAKTVAQLTRSWNEFKAIVVDGWHHITDNFPIEEIRRDLADLGTELLRLRDLVGNFLQKRIDEFKSAFGDLAAFISPALAPIVAAFEYISKRVESVWGQLTGNIVEDCVTLAFAVKKVFQEAGHAIDDVFSKAMEAVLPTVIKLVDSMEELTPGENNQWKRLGNDLRSMQGAFNAEMRKAADDLNNTALEGLEAQREQIVGKLKAEREKAQAERNRLREKDEAEAQNRIRELEKQLAELNAKAREPGPAVAGKGLGMLNGLFQAAPQFATSIGTRGTFSAMQARQFGGNDVAKQTLDETKKIATFTEDTVLAIENGFASWRMK